MVILVTKLGQIHLVTHPLSIWKIQTINSDRVLVKLVNECRHQTTVRFSEVEPSDTDVVELGSSIVSLVKGLIKNLDLTPDAHHQPSLQWQIIACLIIPGYQARRLCWCMAPKA